MALLKTRGAFAIVLTKGLQDRQSRRHDSFHYLTVHSIDSNVTIYYGIIVFWYSYENYNIKNIYIYIDDSLLLVFTGK